MKNKFPAFVCSLTCLLALAGCSSSSVKSPTAGEIVSAVDTQTYHAQYMGKDLKIGDKVKIVEYDLVGDLKHKQSRNMPFAQKKKVIGEATVSSILNDNYYELKSDKPQHVPADAFIEKF